MWYKFNTFTSVSRFKRYHKYNIFQLKIHIFYMYTCTSNIAISFLLHNKRTQNITEIPTFQDRLNQTGIQRAWEIQFQNLLKSGLKIIIDWWKFHQSSLFLTIYCHYILTNTLSFTTHTHTLSILPPLFLSFPHVTSILIKSSKIITPIGYVKIPDMKDVAFCEMYKGVYINQSMINVCNDQMLIRTFLEEGEEDRFIYLFYLVYSTTTPETPNTECSAMPD